MIKKIQTLGLSIESGQPKKGLFKTYTHFKKYFELYFTPLMTAEDLGEIQLENKNQNFKIKKNEDFINFDDSSYKLAFDLSSLALENTKKTGVFHLNWGGDHSIAISTIAAFKNRFPNGKILWIDAHADLNIPNSSPSGNFHGMPVAILMNLLWLRDQFFPWIPKIISPSDIIYLGLRDLDPFEYQTINALNIQSYNMNWIKSHGITRLIQELRDSLSGENLHISFDIDAVCPQIAPSTGLHVPNGLSENDLLKIGFLLNELSPKSMDIVEINPTIGSSQEVQRTYNITFDFLFAIIFGKQKSKYKFTFPQQYRQSKIHRLHQQQLF